MKEDYQQKHRTMVKHAQALTHEMTQLAEMCQQLDSLCRGQQGTISKLHTRYEETRDSQTDKLKDLAEQITLLEHNSAQANGCASLEVGNQDVDLS
jgi:hypothetical protein